MGAADQRVVWAELLLLEQREEDTALDRQAATVAQLAGGESRAALCQGTSGDCR